MAALPGIWWYGFAGGEPRSIASSANMNSSTRQRIACVFRAPRAGTIDRVIFGVSVASSLSNVRVSLYSVSSGNPNAETHYRAHSPSAFAAGAMFRSGWLTTTGLNAGSKRAVAHGELMAVVLSWDFTPSGAASLSWVTADGSPSPANNLHYFASYNGSSWSKSAITPRLSIEYSDGAIEPVGWFPAHSLVNTPNLSNASTPDEVGLRFVLPFTATLSQAALWTGALGAAPFAFKVYDAADVELGSFSIAGTQELQDADSPVFSHFNDIVLTQGEVYRFVALPGSASNCTLGYFTINDYARRSFAGRGQFYYTARTNGGAWTDNDDLMPMFLLGFSDLVPPT